MDFKLHDKVVYPGHGVGVVSKIETKTILGKSHEFLSVDLNSGMTVLVPSDNAQKLGLRHLISKDDAAKVRNILDLKANVFTNSQWNVRYKVYMDKVKTGDIFQVAEVLRDLKGLEKELSFGERKMLDVAKYLVFSELEMVEKS